MKRDDTGELNFDGGCLDGHDWVFITIKGSTGRLMMAADRQMTIELVEELTRAGRKAFGDGFMDSKP